MKKGLYRAAFLGAVCIAFMDSGLADADQPRKGPVKVFILALNQAKPSRVRLRIL